RGSERRESQERGPAKGRYGGGISACAPGDWLDLAGHHSDSPKHAQRGGAGRRDRGDLMSAGIVPLSTPELPAPDAPKPRNPAEAARQFEAILIAQMLRNARGGSNLSGEEDSTSDTMWSVAAQ